MKPLTFALWAGLLACILLLFIWFGFWMNWFQPPTRAAEIVIITMATSAYLYKMLAKMTNPQVFVSVYLGTIALKLVFFAALLFLLRFLEPQALLPNAVLMLVSYIIFTALEVVILFKKVTQ